MKKILYLFLALSATFILNSCDTTNSPTMYEITISAQPMEGGTVSPKSGKFKAGSTVEIKATPSKGWRFVRWKGDYSGTSDSATITVTQDMAITAVFKEKQYNLTINIKGQGTVEQEVIPKETTSYKSGTIVRLTAKPDPNWGFVKWKFSDNSKYSHSVSNPYFVTIKKPITITAIFEKKGIARMHLSQSIQNPERTVPMVAGRDAVLQLFMEIKKEKGNYIHSIDVSLFRNGTKIKVLHEPAGTLTINDINDTLSTIAIPIPGRLIKPDLSLRVKTSNGLVFPEEDTKFLVDVITLPEFHLRLIPINVPSLGKTGYVNSLNKDEYMEALLDMFPINNYAVDVHSPVTVSNDSTFGSKYYDVALSTIHALWLAEGSPDYYYYGVIPEAVNRAGVGYVQNLHGSHTYRQAVGWDNPERGYRSETLAHEIGHNMGRHHSPCYKGAGDVDPNYPYPSGTIGNYGYEVDSGELIDPAHYYDLMSYCDPPWISVYTYKGVLKFREVANSSNNANKRPQEVLLLWGRINNNKLILEPAFKIKAPPSMPQEAGSYTLSGYDRYGNQTFSFSFAGAPVADDLNNNRQFAFTVPIERVDINDLQTIKLSGRNLKAFQRTNNSVRIVQSNKTMQLNNISASRISTNAVSIQWNDSQYKMALVKNAQTGEIIGFLKGGNIKMKTSADALKIYFSDGVHTIQKRVNM